MDLLDIGIDMSLLETVEEAEFKELMLLYAMTRWFDVYPEWGGSVPGKSTNINRNRAEYTIWIDYLAPEPVYDAQTFCRRFRMQPQLFTKIVSDVEPHDRYFQAKPDATGLLGLSALQKVTAAMRMLCYSMAADATEKYCQIAETTAMTSFKRFAQAIINIYGKEYLRHPTEDNVKKWLAITKA